ncbi:MAG TPA: polysaccharide deacetylase family protein [Hyphomicrobium sp.]|jgi:peptidoglycan/xylan/chitin deacetylase (PgdA/CDA1 family)
MRTTLKTTFIAGAALCGLLAFSASASAEDVKSVGPPSVGPPSMGPASPVTKQTECPGNPNPLGVSRVVEIDTTGGPGFGFQHYKSYDFLNPKEVVLTFDDGPLPNRTTAVLAALNAECTRAIFFSVGKVAAGYPEILRDVAKAGNTIGTHTMDHKDLSKMPFNEAKDDIEKSISVVHRAVGGPTAPFFRFPFLRHSPETLKYLADRNVAVFSTDIDSFDFKGGKPEALVKRIMAGLEKRGKGIILMHDIQPHTAAAMPELLKQLKAGGYKVVQMTAKAPIQTLPEYDELIIKDMQGMPTALSDRPMNSVVKTISGQ